MDVVAEANGLVAIDDFVEQPQDGQVVLSIGKKQRDGTHCVVPATSEIYQPDQRRLRQPIDGAECRRGRCESVVMQLQTEQRVEIELTHFHSMRQCSFGSANSSAGKQLPPLAA